MNITIPTTDETKLIAVFVLSEQTVQIAELYNLADEEITVRPYLDLIKNDIEKGMTDCAWREELVPDINELAEMIHENAKEHGWWDEERSIPEVIALCHSELSEALEAYRNGEPMVWINDGKPDGIAVEMIDCIIRILDWCGKENVDVGETIMIKHMYNITRPYKHGGKVI